MTVFQPTGNVDNPKSDNASLRTSFDQAAFSKDARFQACLHVALFKVDNPVFEAALAEYCFHFFNAYYASTVESAPDSTGMSWLEEGTSRVPASVSEALLLDETQLPTLVASSLLKYPPYNAQDQEASVGYTSALLDGTAISACLTLPPSFSGPSLSTTSSVFALGGADSNVFIALSRFVQKTCMRIFSS